MTVVYGLTVEPGGMELDDDRYEVFCNVCGGAAHARSWEQCDGGCINRYLTVCCPHCDVVSGDHWNYTLLPPRKKT